MNSNDISDKDRIKKRTVRLIRIAFVILLVQNLLLPIFVGIYIIGFFPIDLIGFLLLAGGYLLYSTLEVEHKRSYFLGGLCLLGWAICRVLYQYIIPFLFIPQLVNTCPPTMSFIPGSLNFLFTFIGFFWGHANCPDLPLWTTAMTVSIFIGGLALALGTIAIWRTQKGNGGHRIFMLYGVYNAIVISLFVVTGFPFATFGTVIFIYILYVLKILSVPLLGVVAFGLMQRETTTLEDIQSAAYHNFL